VAGIGLALLAALGWGVDSIVARQGLRQIPPAVATFISLCSSLPVIILVAWLLDPGGFGRLTPVAVLWFAVLGLINFVGGRQLNFRATRRLGAARAAAVIAASPMIAVLLAWLLGEQLTLPLAAGAGLIVVGVALVVSGR
jgi:drug/metabolite transporter (DMT)-like permease